MDFLSPSEISNIIRESCNDRVFNFNKFKSLDDLVFENSKGGIKIVLSFSECTPDGTYHYVALPEQEHFLVESIKSVVSVLSDLDVLRDSTESMLKYEFDKFKCSHKDEYFAISIFYPEISS